MDTDRHLVLNGTILISSSVVLLTMGCKFIHDLMIHSREKDTSLTSAVNICAIVNVVTMVLGDAALGSAELLNHFLHKEFIDDIGYWAFYTFTTIEYTCLYLFYTFRLKQSFNNTAYSVPQETVWLLLFSIVLGTVFEWIFAILAEDEIDSLSVNNYQESIVGKMIASLFALTIMRCIAITAVSYLFSKRLLALTTVLRKTTMNMYYNNPKFGNNYNGQQDINSMECSLLDPSQNNEGNLMVPDMDVRTMS